jgi:hypothetical protein
LSDKQKSPSEYFRRASGAKISDVLRWKIPIVQRVHEKLPPLRRTGVRQQQQQQALKLNIDFMLQTYGALNDMCKSIGLKNDYFSSGK